MWPGEDFYTFRIKSQSLSGLEEFTGVTPVVWLSSCPLLPSLPSESISSKTWPYCLCFLFPSWVWDKRAKGLQWEESISPTWENVSETAVFGGRIAFVAKHLDVFPNGYSSLSCQRQEGPFLDLSHENQGLEEDSCSRAPSACSLPSTVLSWCKNWNFLAIFNWYSQLIFTEDKLGDLKSNKQLGLSPRAQIEFTNLCLYFSYNQGITESDQLPSQTWNYSIFLCLSWKLLSIKFPLSHFSWKNLSHEIDPCISWE